MARNSFSQICTLGQTNESDGLACAVIVQFGKHPPTSGSDWSVVLQRWPAARRLHLHTHGRSANQTSAFFQCREVPSSNNIASSWSGSVPSTRSRNGAASVETSERAPVTISGGPLSAESSDAAAAFQDLLDLQREGLRVEWS